MTAQRPNEIDDGRGGKKPDQTTPWVDVVSVWAEIKPATGRELFLADMIKERVTHKLMIRYTTAINNTMRLLYQGRIFEVSSVVDMEERKKFLRIMAFETK